MKYKGIDCRIINYFRDAIEDLRLQNKINYEQEIQVWGIFSEILTTAKYKNPYKIKYINEARCEQSQPIKAILTGESISDLEDFCDRLSNSFSFFLLKLEDRENYLKKMRLLTGDERVMRRSVLSRVKRIKLFFSKESLFLSGLNEVLSKYSERNPK